ncbi:hypothetical protein [Microlunatus sp. Gsoil 973]|jgi:hypothetical protein|uniref:hypothetical protein n=1 Tax=Microlunatus sp. Gsoil 973 TaxID=2672569 RepID=UPI0012B448EF|nr:hypothetical protein [Microlunatus sp. Gsoil 973]QGN33635.1 hypothetical protein GJV80_13380 [Microlunatus sp. Gsoil 973]
MVPSLLVLALLTVCLLIGSTQRAAAEATVAFTITDDRITESSGLATDTDADLYWTVNDSGDSGRAFALDQSGEVVGTIGFRAEVVDVEAVQYADNTLYIADIGDNDAKRPFVTVYLLADPRPNNGTTLYRSVDLAYPDGPHDAETLLVSDTGQLYLITKGAKGGIYQAPRDLSHSSVNTLTRVGDAPPFVTDGQFLADGRIAVRSYVDISVLDPDQGFTVVARAAAPSQPQGESLTGSLDGTRLLAGSEGKASKVYSLPVPTAIGSAPSPGATPPPGASASPDESKTSAAADPGGDSAADEETDINDTQGTSRSGTVAALLVAAAVAVAAGAGVYFARGRRSSR